MYPTRMLSAGLAVLLVATVPVRAQAPLPPTTEDLLQQIKSLQITLKSLAPLEIAERLRTIEDRLRRVEDALPATAGTGISTRSTFYPTTETEVPVPVRLRNLEDRMRAMEAKTGDPRISRSLTPVPALPPMPSSIYLNNTSRQPAVVTINDVPYTLAPGEKKTLSNYPPGQYTYEVEQPGYTERAVRTEYLPAGGYTGLITIRP